MWVAGYRWGSNAIGRVCPSSLHQKKGFWHSNKGGTLVVVLKMDPSATSKWDLVQQGGENLLATLKMDCNVTKREIPPCHIAMSLGEGNRKVPSTKNTLRWVCFLCLVSGVCCCMKGGLRSWALVV